MSRPRFLRTSLAIAAACAVIGLSRAVLSQSDAGSSAPAAPDAGTPQLVSFISCPLHRDTPDAGRKSDCWLADDRASGTRYDITYGPIKPQLGRPVLVEGVVSADPDTCGGVILKPSRTAVLPGVCPSVMLRPDGHAGRPYKSPPEVLQPVSVARALPPPPYDTQTFTIYFEFGRDFLLYQHSEVILDKVLVYAKATQSKNIRIQGFAATDGIEVSRRFLAEPLALAEARARMVEKALLLLGIPQSSLSVEWLGSPAPTDLEGGLLPEPSKRRATITIAP